MCDNDHKECKKQNDKSKTTLTTLPTRLLYVRSLDSPELRLYYPTEKDSCRYVALSYCWGKLSVDDKRKFCTTNENLEARKEQIDWCDLPKTHQDAVKISRELGIAYLWIDSHCIIQFDNGDWEREAKRMEDVYSSAYCVLAATSATNIWAGFLEQNAETEYIYARDRSDQRFYISTDVGDFDRHVEKAPLNNRAWVLQERVLARRTLHFAADHTYWECGAGIYCGNLTKLQW